MEFEQLWNNGCPVRELGKIFRLSLAAVSTRARRLNLAPRIARFTWTDEEDQTLRALWFNRELMLDDIVRRLQKPKETIDWRASKLRLPFPRVVLYKDQRHLRHAPYRWTPERNAKLARLWKEGWLRDHIAKEVNCSIDMVSGQARKLGLTPRVIHGNPRRKSALRQKISTPPISRPNRVPRYYPDQSSVSKAELRAEANAAAKQWEHDER
jgi:hypothetical protein